MLFYFAIYSVFKSSILRSCYVTSDPVALKLPSFPASQLFAGRSKCHRFEEAHLARMWLTVCSLRHGMKNETENCPQNPELSREQKSISCPSHPTICWFLASKIAVWGTWLDQQRPIKQKKSSARGTLQVREVRLKGMSQPIVLRQAWCWKTAWLQFEVDGKQKSTQNKVSNTALWYCNILMRQF